ncbi:MAG: 4Fe-4S cluster-binding domain-containing protein [Nannocystaceae bacterium]
MATARVEEPADGDGEAIVVALVVAETEAEGPGRRFALWVQGCPMRCAGCCNPEMLEFRGGARRRPDALVAEAVAAGVEGVSILGGEPFAQAAALAGFAEGVRAAGLSVMIYSGFTIEELRASPRPGVARLLAAADLLVDGRFDAAQRSARRRFIGSDNQRLHHLSERYAAGDPALAGSQTIELRLRGGELTINGWPALGARTRLGPARPRDPGGDEP